MLVGFSTFNGLAPDLSDDGGKGPKAMRDVFEFSAAINEITRDYLEENQSKQLDFVQTIFVDNSQSLLPVQFVTQGHNQRLIIPAQSFAYLPILTMLPFGITATKVAIDGDNTYVHYINVPMPAIIWSVATGP